MLRELQAWCTFMGCVLTLIAASACYWSLQQIAKLRVFYGTTHEHAVL